jgi:hypothetical protein
MPTEYQGLPYAYTFYTRPPTTSPRKLLQSPQADPDDFSRRLKISSPGPRLAQSSKPHPPKSFNPDTDPIPTRHTAEPESISDSTSSSYPPRELPNRQLFDHRKDDPVHFAVFACPNGRPTPTPKSSGEYISASSRSSYANSVTSSNFTLSSNTTDGSSASSALFEPNGRHRPSQSPSRTKVRQRCLCCLHRRLARRTLPDTSVPELFVLLHGMLFTHIQLDDSQPTLGRLIERLEIEGAEEREWVMMAVINISAVLEYGRPSGVLKKAGGVGGRETSSAAGMRVMAKRGLLDEESMDVDGDTVSPALSEATSSTIEYPLPFKLALQLTFSVLTHVLHNPTRRASQFARSTLNPLLDGSCDILGDCAQASRDVGGLGTQPW